MEEISAVLIAAGMGQRLRPYTDDCPKCMLPLDGKPVIEHILSHIRNAGIHNINIITGYKREKVEIEPASYFFNEDFENNNILFSLMCAEPVFEESLAKGQSLLVSYTDIIYSNTVLRSLLESSGDIVVSVDPDYKNVYNNRSDHPLSEAEIALVDEEMKVVRVGKGVPEDSSLISTEFIGLLKLSPKGIELWLANFRQLRDQLNPMEPFFDAAEFRKAYLTHFLEFLIEEGNSVLVSSVPGGWMEFDTPQDYENLQLRYSNIGE